MITTEMVARRALRLARRYGDPEQRERITLSVLGMAVREMGGDPANPTPKQVVDAMEFVAKLVADDAHEEPVQTTQEVDP